MKNPNQDRFSEEDWEENLDGAVSWSEKNWQLLLIQSSEECRKFAKIYERLSDKNNAFGVLSDTLEWSKTPLNTCEVSLPNKEDSEYNEMAASSIFSQPAYIALRGLFLYVHQIWERLINHPQSKGFLALIPTALHTLKEVEVQALLTLYAIETNESGLLSAISKRTLFFLNRTFEALQTLAQSSNKPATFDEDYIKIKNALFEIRHIILQLKELTQKEHLSD